MKKIAIANQKGGCGKTTSTVNIGARLNELGYSVLLIDLDPQANLTTHLGLMPDELDITIKDLFDCYIYHRKNEQSVEELIDAAIINIRAGLELLPADGLLEVTDNSLVTAISREFILSKIVEKIIEHRGEYDYLLVDCRPTLSTLVVNALTLCNEVLIPVKAQYLDYIGFNQLYNNIELIREATNPNIRIKGVFLTMFDSRVTLNNEIANALKKLQEQESVTILGTMISHATALADAAKRGQDIFTYASAGKAIDRKKAAKSVKEYAALVDELVSEE